MAYDAPDDWEMTAAIRVTNMDVDLTVKARRGDVREDILRKRAAYMLLSGVVEPRQLKFLKEG